MGWEVSGISSWATVGRGATGGCCYCWRRESGERERGVWVKRATTELLHFFLLNARIFSADLLTLDGGRNTPWAGLQLKYLTPE